MLQTLQSAQLLFGMILILFGSGLTLSLLLKIRPNLFHALLAVLAIIELLFAGLITLDFAGVGGDYYVLGSLAELSETLSTHRWLLIQLPIVLIMTALLVLSAYKDRIAEAHAKHYRWLVITCVFVSFLATAIMALESFV